MAELLENNQLRLTAEDLRALTDWPVSLIEDYLSISGDVVQISQETNVVINQTSSYSTQISMIGNSVFRLQRRLQALADFASGNTNQIAMERARRLKLQRDLPAQVMTRVVVGI